MYKKRLSVVMPTYNCDFMLKKSLESIKWADELIVVDSGSSDNTINIARDAGATIFHRIPLNGNFDENRKFGMFKATSEWILKLDSDEIISPELQEEIILFLKNDRNKNINGYYLYNKIYMFGKEVKHGFVKPKSNELRLFRNGKWHYNPYRFHQQITIDGQTGHFKNYYLHFNYRSVSEFLKKMNVYTSFDAPILAKIARINTFQIAISPVKTFIKLFFIQFGFLDGLLGLETSSLYSMYYLVEKIKIWESQKKS